VKTFIRILIICVMSAAVAAVVMLSKQRIVRTVEKEPEGPAFTTLKSFQFASQGELATWEEKLLSKKNTIYTVGQYSGKTCVKAESNDSASTRFFKQTLENGKWPVIAWDWAVEVFPKHVKEESLSSKKEFDFAAQIYVVFYSRFFLNTRAIQYLWATGLPPGMVSDNPYTKNVKVMVLESGPFEGWKHEERNIRDDYKTLFGEELGKDVVGVAFMTDADSTDSTAIAYYTGFTLGYVDMTKKNEVVPVPETKEEETGTWSWLTGLLKPQKIDNKGGGH